MRIHVLLFGQLRDIVGQAEEFLEMEPGSQLRALMSRYGDRFPKFKALAGAIACSVNQEYSSSSVVLRDGDEVGFLPPVSGGKSDVEELKSQHCAIVRERIPTEQITESMKAAEDGATVVFEGIVRDNSRGRRTLYLEYEGYESMALNEMRKIAQAAFERFQVRDVRIVHRLGRLEIGETSILIVVGSAHRGPAFEACRWLIDTLKKTVPIWKKEHFRDGAVWADGEPFPEEIRAVK